MVCNPAKIRIVVYPIDFQTVMIAIDGITHARSLRNLIVSPLTLLIQMFTIPSWESSIHDHTTPATTLEMRKGRMMSPRTTVDLVTRSRITAVAIETTSPMATDSTTKYSVVNS